MDTLKKYFPISFKYTGSVKDLIIGIVIYLVAGLIVSFLLGLVGKILPFLGLILGLVGGIFDLYCTVGIVLQVLVFAKVLK